MLGDQAYSSKATRELSRSRRIKAVIPEHWDQIGNRKRKGSPGVGPVGFDAEVCKGRAAMEQSFSLLKQWRGMATGLDNRS